jgi:hypothetical protein
MRLNISREQGMKKNSLKIILCLTIMMSSAITASTFMVGINGGQVRLSNDFDKPLTASGRVSFMANEGFILEGSAQYFDATSSVSTTPSLKAGIGLASVAYMVPIKSRVRPYAGVSAGVALLNDSYDSPALAYGVKAGFLMSFSRDTKFFIEASKLMINSSIDTVDIDPLTLSLGLGIAFGSNKASEMKSSKNKNAAFKNRRAPQPRGNRRMRNQQRQRRR